MQFVVVSCLMSHVSNNEKQPKLIRKYRVCISRTVPIYIFSEVPDAKVMPNQGYLSSGPGKNGQGPKVSFIFFSKQITIDLQVRFESSNFLTVMCRFWHKM